jgi:hypothetical protein
MGRNIALLAGLLSFALGGAARAEPPAAAPDPAAHRLDGRTFYGRETVKGNEAQNQIYVFKDGTFEALRWKMFTFQPGPYTTTLERDSVHFTATTVADRPQGMSVRWQGTVAGNHIEVTGVVLEPKRPPAEVTGSATEGEQQAAVLMFMQTLREMEKLPPLGSPEFAEVDKQRKSEDRINLLGDALVAWSGDRWKTTPAETSRRLAAAGDAVDLRHCDVVTESQLQGLLVPRFLKSLEMKDGWGNPLAVCADRRKKPGKPLMCVRSAGRDGKFSGTAYTTGKIGTKTGDDFDQDLVWCDGYIVRWTGD